MVWDIVNLSLALVAGLLTGFYFERRQTKSARISHKLTIQQNEDLTRQLDELHRELAMVSTGVRSRVPGPKPLPSTHEREGLRENFLNLAREMQDAAGRVAISLLERNLSDRYTNSEILDVTDQLEAEKVIERNNGFVHILF